MDIICKSCSQKISIPDEKVPKGKNFNLTCPHCQEKISITQNDAEESEPVKSDSIPHPTSGDYELDFVEEGEKVALVCSDTEKESLIAPLKKLGYKVRVSESPAEAINLIRFTVYDLIIVDEKFDCSDIGENILIKYIQPMPMTNRRKMFVVLVGDNLRTLNNMDSFVHSVNMVLNRKDIERIEIVIKKQIQEHERFYKIFKESLVKLGKE